MRPDPATLRACLFFRGKSVQDIEALLQELAYTVTSYPKNALILAEGDPAERLGIVLSGAVEVQKTQPTGGGVTIAHLREGQTIGEAVIFRRENVVPATVTAASPCSIMFIGKQELVRLLSADSGMLVRFIENLSDRLVLVNRKIEVLSAGSLRRRIISFLLELAAQQDSDKLSLPFGRREWAEHLNTARPSLSREIGLLRDKGWIAFKGDTITLLDREAMNGFLRSEGGAADKG